MWKQKNCCKTVRCEKCFSPLAGIRYVETEIWGDQHEDDNVSVPLRGLDMWKHGFFCAYSVQFQCFSPLAGIRYVETVSMTGVMDAFDRFSPLAGIRYVETPPSET